MNKKKVGLFFGTFDPIHNGHLNIAKYIIEENLADQVWLVVTPENPLKLKNNISSFDHRYKMVNIATKKYNNIIPCGIKDKGITNLKEIKNLDYKKLEDIIIKNFTKNLGN